MNMNQFEQQEEMYPLEERIPFSCNFRDPLDFCKLSLASGMQCSGPDCIFQKILKFLVEKE